MAIHVGAGAGKEGAGPLPPPGTTRWRIFSFRIVCYEANKTVAPLVGSWLTSSLPASSCFPALPTSRPAPCLLSRSSVHPHAIYHYSLTLVDSYTNCETHRDTTIERNKCPLGRRLTQEEQGTLSTSRTPHRTSYQSSPVQSSASHYGGARQALFRRHGLHRHVRFLQRNWCALPNVGFRVAQGASWRECVVACCLRLSLGRKHSRRTEGSVERRSDLSEEEADATHTVLKVVDPRHYDLLPTARCALLFYFRLFSSLTLPALLLWLPG